MASAPIKVSLEETVAAPEEDRFQRFSLIGWWDQTRIRNARVLVIGAGALGNEIVKNLSLLGFGNLFVADLDNIENSNLSRSVLYRAKDNGSSKAETAVRAAKDIFPDMKAQAFHGNVLYDLGTGVYRWADVILGGLDNREARLSINRNCRKLGKTWIDGAIEQISGVARVFSPVGPCYECTMSEMDWKLLNKRRSCNLLTKDEMQTGKVPTTPTISSVIAGVQCQEAVKFLHGMETIAGKGFVFNGISCDSYLVEYTENDECYSHETADCVVSLPAKSSDMTVSELLARARADLGPETVLELGRDILTALRCSFCDKTEALYQSLGRVRNSVAICPDCGRRREAMTAFTIDGTQDFLERTFAEIGVPPFDIVWARNGGRLVGYEFSGDAADVLGEVAPPMPEKGA